eukprot:CAMPEP_0181189642 /NCGR_PEP_ID=MMETSP1096-20121128/11769_1 /TAXON_ID=156174 ORGANISM="Chrysochromulina ericina, Strain CCMP281" /NCGR_SAMPLE_ID=MMETSP1096 /ASSEMBLY_ACC=CAM_ASM_000453 /LENGTH=102 /DNA_ID=CAMNT_0023278805 /DNA_START=111 /DNA_END=419 /DNA_ORIENTATION=+
MYEQPNSPPTHTHSGTGMGLRREPSGRTPVHQGQLSTSACHDDLLSSELDWCCSTLCQGRHDTHSDEQRESILACLTSVSCKGLVRCMDSSPAAPAGDTTSM